MFQKQYTPFISKETRLSTTGASGRLVHFPALFFPALILASAAVISAFRISASRQSSSQSLAEKRQQ
jgi:hypothetical protein